MKILEYKKSQTPELQSLKDTNRAILESSVIEQNFIVQYCSLMDN